jgi:transcriptional regulator with XRE-family HTH domain
MPTVCPLRGIASRGKIPPMQINPDALRAIREKDGLSQEALAKAAGLTQPHISQIESGVRSPWPSTVKKLAEALRVPVSALTAVDAP